MCASSAGSTLSTSPTIGYAKYCRCVAALRTGDQLDGYGGSIRDSKYMKNRTVDSVTERRRLENVHIC